MANLWDQLVNALTNKEQENQEKANYQDFVQDTQVNPEKYPFVQSLTPQFPVDMEKKELPPIVPPKAEVVAAPAKPKAPVGNALTAMKNAPKVLAQQDEMLKSAPVEDQLMNRMAENNQKPEALPANPYESEMAEADQFADEVLKAQEQKPEVPEIDPALVAMQKRRDELMFYKQMLDGVGKVMGGAGKYTPSENLGAAFGEKAKLEEAKYNEITSAKEKKAKSEKDAKLFDLDVKSKEQSIAKINKEMQDDKLMSDSSSDISKAVQEATKQRLMKIGWTPEQLTKLEAMSAKQIEGMFGKMNPEYIYQTELQAQQNKENAAARRAEMADRAAERQAQRDIEKGKEARLEDQFARSEVKNYQFKAEDQVKKLREIQQGADELDGLLALADSNPQSYNAIGTKLAKAMGEVGALTENDVTRYVGRKDLQGRIAKAGNDLMKGTIRQEDMKYIKEIVDVLREKSNRKIDKVYRDAASLYSKNTGVPMEKAEAYFNISKPAQATVAKKEYSPSRNQTRITYSDGKVEVVDGKQ